MDYKNAFLFLVFESCTEQCQWHRNRILELKEISLSYSQMLATEGKTKESRNWLSGEKLCSLTSFLKFLIIWYIWIPAPRAPWIWVRNKITTK